MNTSSGVRTKPCFTAPCPMCMERRTFFLLEHALGLSGEFFVKGVACETCAYEAFTYDSDEREKLRRASVIWGSRAEGTFTDDHAAELLAQLNSAVLATIQEEGRIWLCASCGERNGMSFLECWSCQHERRVDS